MSLQLMFPREQDASLEQVVSHGVLAEIYRKILNMTDQDEDQHLPSTRGIEMVLLALEEMPALVAGATSGHVARQVDN